MIPIENNSWDYVQGLIEKDINSAFKLRIKEDDKMKFEKDHPYMKRLDEVLKQFLVVKMNDIEEVERGEDSEDYEEMKQVILDALFMRYAGETIRK